MLIIAYSLAVLHFKRRVDKCPWDSDSMRKHLRLSTDKTESCRHAINKDTNSTLH
jgi:hypothetical protein